MRNVQFFPHTKYKIIDWLWHPAGFSVTVAKLIISRVENYTIAESYIINKRRLQQSCSCWLSLLFMGLHRIRRRCSAR